MKTLVIDVGGSHVKALVNGRRKPIKIPSGPTLTPRAMVRAVRDATADWTYDTVTIGYPGPVLRGHVMREPWNLGRGWTRFDFRAAFGRPVRLINDAAMQALGSYEGGYMMFLGLGTGLGTTMIRKDAIVPMELAHLPYRHGQTYEDYLGERGLKRLGSAAWRRHVAKVAALFLDAFEIDYIVFGGGNSRLLKTLPPHTQLGSNANAFKGGFRVWSWRPAKP